MKPLAISILSALCLGAIAANVDAQTFVPPSATTQLGGSAVGYPFSYTAYTRYQVAIDKSLVPVGFIYGMSLRALNPPTSVKERQWQEMQITLADLTATSVSGLGSANLDNNMATNQVVAFNGRFNIYRPNPSDALEFSVTIPFAKSFLYVGTAPLIVDIMPSGQGYEQWPGCGSGGNGTAMDATSDSRLYSVLAQKGNCTTKPNTGFTPAAGGLVIKFYTAPMLMPFGKGCKGSAGIPQIGSTGSATLGSNFSFTMSGAPTNANNSVIVIGLSNQMDGSTRLPLDLSPATSLTGCWQNTEALLIFFLAVTSGQSALPVTIPNNSAIKGVEIFSQFAVDDPSAGGFSVTQGGVIRPQ